jgi:hypothetical protein
MNRKAQPVVKTDSDSDSNEGRTTMNEVCDIIENNYEPINY